MFCGFFSLCFLWVKCGLVFAETLECEIGPNVNFPSPQTPPLSPFSRYVLFHIFGNIVVTMSSNVHIGIAFRAVWLICGEMNRQWGSGMHAMHTISRFESERYVPLQHIPLSAVAVVAVAVSRLKALASIFRQLRAKIHFRISKAAKSIRAGRLIEFPVYSNQLLLLIDMFCSLLNK